MRQLEVLLAVAQSGSMAKAAERLAITQPVVSKTIADLENTLGMRLFDRSPQGVEATLYGRALLKRSTAVFNDLRTSVTELDFLSDPTAGELRVGSSEAVASGLLGAIIDRLSRQHPRLTFEVTLGAGLTDLQYRELQAHDIDLIIGRLPGTMPADTEVDVLYAEKFFVVAGRQNPWARRRRIELAELIGERWCAPSFESFPWSLIGDAFRSRRLAPPRQISGNCSTERVAFWRGEPGAQDPADRYAHSAVPGRNRHLAQPDPEPIAQLFIACAREIAKAMVKSK